MFRKIRNVIASFVRHASIAQRLDDAVTLSDGQREHIANLESELAYTYRRIEHMRFELDEAEAEAATLRAATAPRPASTDLDKFDGGCAADP